MLLTDDSLVLGFESSQNVREMARHVQPSQIYGSRVSRPVDMTLRGILPNAGYVSGNGATALPGSGARQT